MTADAPAGGSPGRPPWEPEFTETFQGHTLDLGRWLPHYLPHWTTAERSAARYDLGDGILRLRIDADQPAWRDGDGELRVSNLQSGSFSGPTGSARGQHRHRDDLAVTSPQPVRQLYTPSSGRVEAILRARPDPTTMLAFWLVGFEQASPDDAGEICVVELFGDAIGPARSMLNIGVKAHHDPRLYDDMATVELELDATRVAQLCRRVARRRHPLPGRRPGDPERRPADHLPAAADARPVRVPGREPP